MKLKSVIHYPDTNSVEATWVEVVTPEFTDAEGNVTPAVERQVRCHSYHETQMADLEADLGADLPEYTALIATVRAAIHVPTPEEVAAQLVAATDVVCVVQKSGTDKYMTHVTNVAAGSFQITFATTGGTTTEQPVFNFALIKGAVS